MTEATFVFRHTNEAEARRFCKELLAQFPFMGDGETHVIAMATGDAMSVSDAVRAALLCSALDGDYERAELALSLTDCNNWDDCMKLAADWELQYHEGQFVDLRTASVDTHPKGGDAQQAPSLMGSAVGNAETPQPPIQSPPLSQGDE